MNAEIFDIQEAFFVIVSNVSKQVEVESKISEIPKKGLPSQNILFNMYNHFWHKDLSLKLSATLFNFDVIVEQKAVDL